MEMDSELQRILNENTLLKSQNQTLQNEIARVQRELSTAQAARHKAEQQTEQTTATLRAARKDWKKWKSWWMEQSQKLRPYLEAVAVSPCRIQQSDGPPTTTKKRKFSSDAPASASEAMPLMSKTPLQATAPVPAPKASSSTQAPHLILHSRPQANHRPDLTVLVEDTQFSHPYGLPQPQPRQLVTRDHESSTDSRSEHNHQSGQAMTEPQNAGTHTQLELPARAPPSDSSATYESPSQPEASLEQHYLQNQQELHGPASQDDKRIETQTKASPVAQPNSRGKLGPSSAQPKSGNSLSFAPVRSRNQEDLPQTNRQARRSLDSARSNGPTQSPLRSPPKKARPCNQKSARPFARDLKENDVNATPKGTSQPRRPQTLPVEGSSKEVKAESPDASILMWRDERGSGGTGRKRKPEASEVDTADVSYEKMMDSIRKKRKQEIQADPLKYKGRGAYAKGMPVKGDETITARYAIDASRNNGMKQPFNQVVRKQDERKQMHGGNCPCCNGFTERMSELTGQDIQAHQDKHSKHRYHWQEPDSPPSFWDMGFPNTQKVASINKQAQTRKAGKQARIEAEAAQANGRYKRR